MEWINKNSKSLIIGAGEIGQSLKNVLVNTYEIYIRDIKNAPELKKHKFDVLHICYPYSDKFIDITKEYLQKYQPKLTIIHSTIAPGTARKLGKGVVHSPVNGRHPHLESGIKTFTKFVGSVDPYALILAKEYLERAGLKVEAMSQPECTEIAKISCTSIQYALSIIAMKTIAKICEDYNLPFFEVYTKWNNAYNDGYERLNEKQFIRPVLNPIPGPIGGHCVLNNCELLKNQVMTFVKEQNALYNGVSDLKE